MGAHLPTRRERVVHQLVTLALIGANLVAFNALLSPWAAARMDLTRDHVFSISPATRNLLHSLHDDLYVYGYFSKRTHPKLAPLIPQIEDLLDEYRALNRKRIHVEILDPGQSDRVEQEANDRFGVTSTPFRLASKYESGIVNAYFALVIKYGDQYVRYGFEDLIQVEPQPDGDVDVRLRNLEYDLTRAIKKVVYGFGGTTQLFQRLGKPVRLTAVWTPDRLPPALSTVPGEVRKAAQELAGASPSMRSSRPTRTSRPTCGAGSGRSRSLWGSSARRASICSATSRWATTRSRCRSPPDA
jgi:ABC-2 type transport system permease protein